MEKANYFIILKIKNSLIKYLYHDVMGPENILASSVKRLSDPIHRFFLSLALILSVVCCYLDILRFSLI